MATLAYDVVVLGGGHAGVRAAREIVRRRRPGERIDVALVSRDNVELWHGLMPQMLSNTVQPRHVLVPLREVVEGVSLYTYEIRQLDLERRTVTIDRGHDGDERILSYRFLVLAVGSVIDLSRFKGMQEHALPTKTIGDFIHLRNQVIGMLELAAAEPDAQIRAEELTFVVAGAGFAGVEVASEIEELVRSSLPLYPQLDRREIRVVCVDPAPRILPNLSQRASEMARRELEARGVELRPGVGVASASAHDVRLTDGAAIRSRTLVATAGTGSNPLLEGLGLPLERGRVRCDQFGRVLGRPEVFAAGDAGAIPDARGVLHPPTVTFAVSQGEAVGTNVLAAIRGQEPQRRIKAGIDMVAMLSRKFGIAEVRGRAIGGRLAVAAGRLTFLRYMPNWRRRLRLLIDWGMAGFLSRDVTQMQVARSQAVLRMRFSAGDEIVRQGELGNAFYVVTEGSVEVLDRAAGEERPIRRLQPGDHFGELALSAGIRRTATVRALTDTTVIAIDRRDFGAIAQGMPSFLQQFEPKATE
jgi:NADH dehydrogenase